MKPHGNSPMMTAEESLHRAIEAHNSGDYATAIALYRGALALDPALNDARHLLGIACGRSGRVLEGLRLLLDALRVVPGHSIAQINLQNLRASMPYTPLGMTRLADLPPPRGDGADLECGRAWCATVRSDETYRIEHLPTVVASPDQPIPDLLARAAYPHPLEQRSGTATLSKLENVYLDAATGAIFDDQALFLESCVTADPDTRIEDVAFDSPISIFHYTDKFLAESHANFQTGTKSPRFYVRSASVEEAPLISQTSVWLGGTSNYYHWVLESLTRVQVVRESGIDDRALQYVVAGRPATIVVETLQDLGIERDRILFLPPSVHRFRSLLIPSVLAPKSQMTPSSIHFLREALPSSQRSDLPQRIYVSRKDAGIRRVTNEAEILDRLKPFGVVDVSLSAMSSAEQRSLFAGAELVVAPHGAGLANLVFCRPGTPVIELSPYRWHPCFGKLASLVSCRLHVVFPRKEVQKIAQVPITYEAGTNPLFMEFDPAVVEQAVHQALSSSTA